MATRQQKLTTAWAEYEAVLASAWAAFDAAVAPARAAYEEIKRAAVDDPPARKSRKGGKAR